MPLLRPKTAEADGGVGTVGGPEDAIFAFGEAGTRERAKEEQEMAGLEGERVVGWAPEMWGNERDYMGKNLGRERCESRHEEDI